MMKIIFILCIVALLQLSTFAAAQKPELQRSFPFPVACGQIVQGQFDSNFQENKYVINLNTGDAFTAIVKPVGGQLNTFASVTGPTNLGVSVSNARFMKGYIDTPRLETQSKLESGVLSASGTYTIRIVNFRFAFYKYDVDEYNSLLETGGIGVYTLSLECTLADGTFIAAGDQGVLSNISQPQPALIAFSGTGFPGLAPVDFATVAKIPMISNVPMTGGVAPDGSTILGYTVEAAANDTLALGFTRLSGNLNLGLVVLSADNEVVFQASLVTSSELTTKFTVPTASTYTIGVFRIDLLPPATPEATAFQVTATLNP